MQKLIKRIENNYLIAACALFGLLLVLFPHYIAVVVPYVMGVGLILYACVNAFQVLKGGDREGRPGQYLLYLVVGVVTLLQREGSFTTLGVIWAILILRECSEEIDEFYETRELHVFKLIWTIISLFLAFMLMHDPKEHFVFHMRILGLEIIAYSMLHLNDRRLNVNP